LSETEHDEDGDIIDEFSKINANIEEQEYKEFIEFQKWKKLRNKMNNSPKSSQNLADSQSV